MKRLRFWNAGVCLFCSFTMFTVRLNMVFWLHIQMQDFTVPIWLKKGKDSNLSPHPGDFQPTEQPDGGSNKTNCVHVCLALHFQFCAWLSTPIYVFWIALQTSYLKEKHIQQAYESSITAFWELMGELSSSPIADETQKLWNNIKHCQF